MNFHEDLKSKVPEKEVSTKKFGLVLSLILLMGAAHFFHTTLVLAGLMFMLAMLTLAGVFLFEGRLNRVKKRWLWASSHMHRFTNTILLIAIYGLILTPTGLLLRLMGKDVLRMRKRDGEKSYWLKADSTQGKLSDQF